MSRDPLAAMEQSGDRMRMLAGRTDPNGWAYRPKPQICAIWDRLFKGEITT